MNTPSDLNRSVSMVGVKELLKTPKPVSEIDLFEVKELLKTPDQPQGNPVVHGQRDEAPEVPAAKKHQMTLKYNSRHTLLNLIKDNFSDLGIVIADPFAAQVAQPAQENPVQNEEEANGASVDDSESLEPMDEKVLVASGDGDAAVRVETLESNVDETLASPKVEAEILPEAVKATQNRRAGKVQAAQSDVAKNSEAEAPIESESPKVEAKILRKASKPTKATRNRQASEIETVKSNVPDSSENSEAEAPINAPKLKSKAPIAPKATRKRKASAAESLTSNIEDVPESSNASAKIPPKALRATRNRQVSEIETAQSDVAENSEAEASVKSSKVEVKAPPKATRKRKASEAISLDANNVLRNSQATTTESEQHEVISKVSKLRTRTATVTEMESSTKTTRSTRGKNAESAAKTKATRKRQTSEMESQKLNVDDASENSEAEVFTQPESPKVQAKATRKVTRTRQTSEMESLKSNVTDAPLKVTKKRKASEVASIDLNVAGGSSESLKVVTKVVKSARATRQRKASEASSLETNVASENATAQASTQQVETKITKTPRLTRKGIASEIESQESNASETAKQSAVESKVTKTRKRKSSTSQPEAPPTKSARSTRGARNAVESVAEVADGKWTLSSIPGKCFTNSLAIFYRYEKGDTSETCNEKMINRSTCSRDFHHLIPLARIIEDFVDFVDGRINTFLWKVSVF